MGTTAVGLGAEECPPGGVQLAGRSRPVVAAQDPPHSAALM